MPWAACRHNALDACWAANKWAAARADAREAAALVEERQYLYQEFTLQMHGKNRKMLKGYRADNTRVSGNTAHKEYSADPASRYNNFHDRAHVEWAAAARAGPLKGHPNLTAVGPARARSDKKGSLLRKGSVLGVAHVA